jgi:hypothetical protein
MSSIVSRVTLAMRNADVRFDKVGGSTRHYVRDCFLPELEEAGLQLVEVEWFDKFVNEAMSQDPFGDEEGAQILSEARELVENPARLLTTACT